MMKIKALIPLMIAALGFVSGSGVAQAAEPQFSIYTKGNYCFYINTDLNGAYHEVKYQSKTDQIGDNDIYFSKIKTEYLDATVPADSVVSINPCGTNLNYQVSFISPEEISDLALSSTPQVKIFYGENDNLGNQKMVDFQVSVNSVGYGQTSPTIERTVSADGVNQATRSYYAHIANIGNLGWRLYEDY